MHVHQEGGAQRYFSMRGGMMLAARRCMPGTSAFRFGLALGIDVHGSSVTRYEIRLRAALNVSFVGFIRQCQLAVVQAHIDAPFQADPAAVAWAFDVCLIRGDATNAQCWQRSKLHSTEVMIVFCTQLSMPDSALDEVLMDVVSRRLLADLQVLREWDGACNA